MSLPTPTNPANSQGIGEYPFNPQWFLKLPVANTLNGQEAIWGWQNGALVQFPISLIPQLEAVTSVGLALPVSVFNVTGSPVTTTGTLTGTFTNQAQNSVFAGPSSGGAGVPGFRALVASDLPTVQPAQGGTGRTTLTAHAVLIGEGTSAINQVGPGTTGQMLLGVTGVDPAFGNNPVITGGTIDGAVVGGTTPAAGTFTALNSTSGALNGSIGQTTPAAGSFTNLSSSGTVSGTGFSNYLASPPAIGGTAAAAGSFTTLSSTGNFTPSQTNGIVGTTTNNNANAGSVGEFISSIVLVGSAVPLTANTTANVTSISLTAGDWDVNGVVAITEGGTTTSASLQVGITSTSATMPTFGSAGTAYYPYSAATGNGPVVPTGVMRFSLAATTTIFLVCNYNFSVSTASAYGFIGARRRR